LATGTFQPSYLHSLSLALILTNCGSFRTSAHIHIYHMVPVPSSLYDFSASSGIAVHCSHIYIRVSSGALMTTCYRHML